MGTFRSRMWDAAAVTVEEVYHFIVMALCAYDLVLDTYYSIKPKREISAVALSMALFVFHTIFLGRSRHSSVAPSKLVHLLDMLFHVGTFTMDAALVVSLVQNPPEHLGTETVQMQWNAVGNSKSIPLILAGIVYHIAILVTYYRWVQLRPPTVTPCRPSNCLSWLGDAVRTRLRRRPAAMLTPPPLLGDAMERERPIQAQQICLPPFELQRRQASGAVSKRRPAAQASERRDGKDERLAPTGAHRFDQEA